eukprot:g72787.t1
MKPLSCLLTSCLRTLLLFAHIAWDKLFTLNHIKPIRPWFVKNSQPVESIIEAFNRSIPSDLNPLLIPINTFATLYTMLPHNDLKTRMRWFIFLLLDIGRDLGSFTHLTVSWNKQTKSYSNAKLANNPKWEEHQLIIDANMFSFWFDFLIDNTFIQFGSFIFRQVIRIPMGTNCAVFTADLYVFSYELDFIYRLIRYRQYDVIEKFRFTLRYLDDILKINNNLFLELRSFSADNLPFIFFFPITPRLLSDLLPLTFLLFLYTPLIQIKFSYLFPNPLKPTANLATHHTTGVASSNIVSGTPTVQKSKNAKSTPKLTDSALPCGNNKGINMLVEAKWQKFSQRPMVNFNWFCVLFLRHTCINSGNQSLGEPVLRRTVLNVKKQEFKQWHLTDATKRTAFH